MAESACVRLEGELTLKSVAGRLKQPLPEGGNDDGNLGLIFDLSGVTRVDSAALALLLAWLRRAKALDARVELRAMPESLLALARLYGVDVLLPGAPDAI